ncbi:cyclic nucleotide-binding domain-containing protein [Cerasicoccus maritimus]|uniref:cyclic nucleotide-binding domain-containing protein n=1 Tax=Cerasicoccus maritimus TaxID=490089 RepID=UPI0028528F79|nr:cyclic nucleotide-binding domain-containing protein [Cerasicoccus maritimus]
MERRRYAAGSVIFRQGDESQDVYRIVSGQVQIGIDDGNGKDMILATLGEEDIFGEMAMIDESPRSATVTVVEDCDLEVMEPGDFTETFFTNPVVLAPYLACLIDRLRTSNEKLFDLSQKLAQRTNGSATRPPPTRSIGSRFIGTGMVLIPKSPQAKRSMAQPRVPISKFPFRVGRSGSSGADILQKNDLSLINIDPSQVAKNHISIEQEDGAVWIRDRKTRRGTMVNGRRLHQDDGMLVCRLSKPVNEIILGDDKSPAIYELRVLQA